MPLDMDSCAVTVTPAALLSIFGTGAAVTLVRYAPTVKDHPHFQDWVYIAKSEIIMRIHPALKIPLYEQLRLPPHPCKIYMSQHSSSFTTGSLMILLADLVDALQGVDCQSVRLLYYGMKTAAERFEDPAQYCDHPLKELNIYDIGCEHPTADIALVTPASAENSYRQYPGLLRVGKGYGGVEYESTSRRDGIHHFKAYPALAHVLKAQAMGAGKAEQPQTVRICRAQLQTLKAWAQRVQQCPADDFNGLRLEVSVRAPSLQHAIHAARQSKLLDARSLVTSEAGRFQLKIHTVKKEDIFADLARLYQAVEERNILSGPVRSTMVQKQVLIDLYNALGWNPGRRPTPIDSPTAWWKENAETLGIASRLEAYSTPAKGRELLFHIQAILPCQRCKEVGKYALSGRIQFFRITCQLCKHHLSAKGMRDHLAQLIAQHEIALDLDALVQDVSSMTFLPLQQRSCRLSTRNGLSHLVRTQVHSEKENSLLCALASTLLDNIDGDDDAFLCNAVTTAAIDWLRTNINIVHRHIGSESPGVAAEQLSRLWSPADRKVVDDALLLHGIAGAYDRSIAFLVLKQVSFTCQVIPVGSTGPFLGVVQRPSKGYELFGLP